VKILYHHRIASKDGQYVHVEELTNALKKLGHEIIMVGPKVVEQKEFGSDGGFVAKLKKNLPSALYEILEFCYSFIAFAKLAAATIRHKPDGFYERYNLFMPAGIWIKKIFKLPMLLEVNAPLFDERTKYNGIKLKKLAKWSENYTWRNADYVLPVTRVLAEIIKKHANVPEERIRVIPNGIDPEKFKNVPTTEDAKKRLGLDGKFILGFTGFVREWHRLDLVVDVLADTRLEENMHFLIVGAGPVIEFLEQRAIKLGVHQKMTVTGIINRDSIADYIAAFDIALQPDVVDYASPLKLFEYLALGKPVIAPQKDNIREIIEHKVNGMLILFENVNLIQAITRIKNDTLFSASISQEAKHTITVKKLTWENNAAKVIFLFSRIS